MTRVSLSDDSDYHLVNDEQDVRGRTVVDGTGQPIGTVEAMLIDTDAELVTTLVLDNGTEIPARDVTLGDDVVYYSGSAAGTSADATTGSTPGMASYGGHVVRREHVANVNETFDTDFDDADFQAHHATTYATSGRTYAQMQPAYDYGRTAHATYPGDFDTHEASMRSDYESRYGNSGDSAWDDVKDAVRHGYTRAKNAIS